MLYRNYAFRNQDIISAKFLDLCRENKYDVYGVYHPDKSYEFLENLEEFYLEAQEHGIWKYIRGFGINVINPRKNNFIHIDPWFDSFSRYRFIFPISGTAKSSVAFYETNETPDKEIYINNHLDEQKTFKYFSKEDNLTEIGRVTTEIPAVIDTQTLHSAQNPGNEIRIIAMIGLDEKYDITQ